MAPTRFLSDSSTALTDFDLTDYEEKQGRLPSVPPLKKTEEWAWVPSFVYLALELGLPLLLLFLWTSKWLTI